jgi:hypothetical protein
MKNLCLHFGVYLLFSVSVFPQPVAFPTLCRSLSPFHIPFCWVQIGSWASDCLAVDFCLSLHSVFSLRRSSFPCRFSFWRHYSTLDFPTGDWFRVSRFLASPPSLISLDPDVSPVHASLVLWSEWLPILFVCAEPVWILCSIIFLSRSKDTVLHPHFTACGFPAHPACRGL